MGPDPLSEYGDTGPVIHAETKFGSRKPPGPPIQPPGGGGFDGMEPRVARLESDVAHIKGDIADIKQSLRSAESGATETKVKIGVIEEQLRHTPTKTYSITVAIAIVAALAMIVGFAPQVQSFFQGLIPGPEETKSLSSLLLISSRLGQPADR